jgi:hypothetical protein
MIKFSYLFAITFTSASLLSCDGKQTDNTQPRQETPKALQDEKLVVKSYSRTGDLTEELYQELVDQTPALKKLEEDLEHFAPKPNDLKDKFDEYADKSNSYYNSANYKAAAISDSVLRKKITLLIAASNKQFASKTAELNSLITQISKNGASINDHHSVLKIVLTLPLIEKYQDNNKPGKKEFKDLINQQENLLSKTKSITPKF